jgi:hypothetical protein
MGWVIGLYDSPRPRERHSLLVLKVMSDTANALGT